MSDKQGVPGGMAEVGVDGDGDGMRKGLMKSLGVEYLDEWDGFEAAVSDIHRKYQNDDYSDESYTITTEDGQTFTITVSEIEDMGVLDTVRQYVNGRERFLGLRIEGEWDDYMVLHYDSEERLGQMVGASIISVM